MSLENLVSINRLQKHTATPESILKLLSAAKRNLADAQVSSITPENRFDAAYKAILQCAVCNGSAVGKWVSNPNQRTRSSHDRDTNFAFDDRSR